MKLTAYSTQMVNILLWNKTNQGLPLLGQPLNIFLVSSKLCLECVSYFCNECYKYVHDKKENSKHKKTKIDFYVPLDIKCLQHPKIINNLFCIDEKGNYNY